jgi:hypoxanthine phosphoribosyltransferase
MLRDEMVSYIQEKEIKELVSKIAKEIETDYKGLEIVFICALKGSVPFIADLMRAVNLPQRVDFVKVTAASDDTNEDMVIKITKDLSLNITGKHVIIVEEIIDTARTLLFLRDRLLTAQPASLKIVTLLDKPARRVVKLKPDYVGRVIEDRYVVGYGLDENEMGRNYRDIYYLKH